MPRENRNNPTIAHHPMPPDLFDVWWRPAHRTVISTLCQADDLPDLLKALGTLAEIVAVIPRGTESFIPIHCTDPRTLISFHVGPNLENGDILITFPDGRVIEDVAVLASFLNEYYQRKGE